MKKVFIWWICSTCGEPVDIVDVCSELGHNAFGQTNFHGELSIEETEKLKTDLINELVNDGRVADAESIKHDTKVIEVEFKL